MILCDMLDVGSCYVSTEEKIKDLRDLFHLNRFGSKNVAM